MSNRSKARQGDMARWYERRSKIAKLVEHWHQTHRDRWEPQHELVQAAIRAAVHELAFDAVSRNPKDPRMAPFGKPRFDRMMRQLVSQLRWQRHGPVQHADAGKWLQQRDAICDELGWSWVNGKERELPLTESQRSEAA